MNVFLIVLLLNLGFAAALSRLSNWYRLKTEDYLFHMMCLNLVVLVLYIGKYFEIAADYPIPTKFFVALIVVHIFLEPFRKGLLKRFALLLHKFRSKVK